MTDIKDVRHLLFFAETAPYLFRDAKHAMGDQQDLLDALAGQDEHEQPLGGGLGDLGVVQRRRTSMERSCAGLVGGDEGEPHCTRLELL